MKKFIAFLLAGVLSCTSVLALEGEMGYFGGISPGQKLPTTTELAQQKNKKVSKYTLPYKENIYITGKPVTVTGTIEFKPADINLEEPTGAYTESYIIKAEDKATDSKVTRTITLDTKYIYDASRKQMTKTSEMKKWTEVVKVEGNTYQLDSKQSSFSKSMIEDYTPGIMYYSGDVQYEAVYGDVTGENGSTVSVKSGGRVYGYDHAYAKTETQKRKIWVENGKEQYYIEETPTFTSHKDLQYGANEPGAISFAGNYKELISGEGAVMYTIIAGNQGLYDDEKVGAVNVTNTPSIEQLPFVDIPQMAGHPALSDVKKMYSLGIFTGNPKAFSPNQVVTRGEYITMLVRALQIPVPATDAKKSSKKKDTQDVVNPFTDIDEQDSIYPYAMAAYNSGLVDAGAFNDGAYLTREELLVLNIRAIGLERLGIASGGMYTPYIDDNLVSSWAKSSVYAASKIGLIESNNGYLIPKKKVSYIEAASFINRLLEYLRYDLQKDYNEKMMM